MTEDDEAPASEPGRFKRRVILSLVGIATLLVVTVPFWAPLLLRRLEFFRARKLEIVGTRYIPASEIIARANVDTTRSVWDALDPIGARVKAHPGVAHVEVSRRLPNTIVITITEHQPIALVSGPQGFRVFDARGVALPIDPSRIDVDAPVLASPDTGVLRLLGEMRSTLPPLYASVSEVTRVGPRELLFQMDDVPVRTTSNVTLADLYQLAPVQADLKARSARVIELDLRFKDQIIARVQ